MTNRSSGILMHITSLPSRFGIGDLGQGAYDFVDRLSAAGQSYWQILPINPTAAIHRHSPYSSTSAFAGNILLIDPEQLHKDGYLLRSELDESRRLPYRPVDFDQVVTVKKQLMELAYQHFNSRLVTEEFDKFCVKQSQWLDDYACFVAMKDYLHGCVWSDWPLEYRDRDPQALAEFTREKSEEIQREKFLQFVFFIQWQRLREYATRQGIRIIGDIPIYVNDDSSDVWANAQLFNLNKQKKPQSVAGVPPDYFSATGQLWGNPVYDWDALKAAHFSWWIERIRHNLGLFDIVRIDHFRGLVAFWEVSAGERTAVNGHWSQVPVEDFCAEVFRAFPNLPVIAEDLGIITPDVREIMARYHIPGMKVLLFAFGSDEPDHPYLPHNFEPNCIAYTGTHDNNTVKGWFQSEASDADKTRLAAYLGRVPSAETVSWDLIRLALSSTAQTVIIPMQDILTLGADARMNIPGTIQGNWAWRASADQLNGDWQTRLLALSTIYGRKQADIPT